MKIKAILFDLDETLIAEESSNLGSREATCQHARSRSGIDPQRLAEDVRGIAVELWRASAMFPYLLKIGISSWEGLWGSFAGDGPELQALANWIPEYRAAVWSRALLEQGVSDRALVDELVASYVRERRARHVVYPDTEPALRQLGGYRLALVTNGAPAIQREKLSSSGLGPYFDAVVVSGEVGVGKPDARIFEAALSRIDAAPAEAIMVGDSIRRDIGGAKAVGMGAIWINRGGRSLAEGNTIPDAELSDLSGIDAALLGIEGGRIRL